MTYLNAVGEELKKSWWNAIVVVVFTIARLVYGWGWLSAGWEKLTAENWLGDGKFDAGGKIQTMVHGLQHSHGADPLHLNNLIIWFANHIFLNMGGLVDFLVVFFEIFIGIFVIFGFGLIWSLVVALFLNLQFAAAGSANNFGYLVTDVVWLQFPKYANLIGIDGYLRYKKNKALLGIGIGK
jgi:thiosulfate dehydrogenase [quinone] large subunit